MATTLLPPIPDDELDTALKIKSVKQLPQSKQVPTIYTTSFHHTEIIDTHLVIKALRDDVLALQQLLVDPINFVLTNHTLVLQEILVRLDGIDLIQVDFEARISALEGFHP